MFLILPPSSLISRALKLPAYRMEDKVRPS